MKLTLLPALLALLPFAQDDAAKTEAPAATQEAAAKSEFGAPLVVNGKTISENTIKRFLIYGVGSGALSSRKLEGFTSQEVELRNAAGEDTSQYDVTEEEFLKEYNKTIDQFTSRYPMLDADTEVGRAYKSVEWYRRQLRQTIYFDKIFFPTDPADWPEVTKEAIYSGSPEVDLVEDAKKNHDRRMLYAEENGTEYVPEDEMFMGLLRDYMIMSLTSLVTIKTAADGIPEEFVMIIDGGGFRDEITTKDFYEEIRIFVSEQDIADAKRFLALCLATEDRLREDKILLSDEDHQAFLDKLTGDLENTFFNMDFLALQGHQFPSVVAYKEYTRLMESYRTKLASELADGEDGQISGTLRDHLQVANSVMGLAKADAEVILVSSYDWLHNKWKDGGWKSAEENAWAIKDDLDAHRAKIKDVQGKQRDAQAKGETFEPEEDLLPFEQYWAQVLDLKSEYWDPPMPVSGKMPPMQGMKLKGRFGLNTRNDLERAIGESAYSHLINGYSITDTIFFDLDTGQVAGPYKGPFGYYIILLRTRTAPTSPLRLSEPKHIELLKEDYTKRRFIKYAQEALANAEVSGL